MYENYLVKVPKQDGIVRSSKNDRTNPCVYVYYKYKTVVDGKVKYKQHIIGKLSKYNQDLMYPNEKYYSYITYLGGYSEQMSLDYDLYLGDHIQNVKRAYDWLEARIPEVKELMAGHEDILLEHDKSKYSQEEYEPYDAYFYGGNRSYKVVQNFNCAWLHHIHANPHHWQHWVLIQDDPDAPQLCIEMPTWYVVEMICDWWSFSFRNGDLTGIFDWYEKHDNILLHPETKKIVDRILKQLKAELENEFKNA